MLTSSFLVFFTFIASLVSAATLYRGDGRGPKAINDAGGFYARGNHDDHEKYEATVFQHVTKSLKRPNKDPFISTSTDPAEAAKQGGNKYLYTINSDEIEENINDVAAMYEAENKVYPYPNEKEFAVEYHIPLQAITKVEKFVDGQWKSIKLSKRGLELFDKDVFVN
ncbi:hypothetical protein CkaCkLH20_07252 [Colletotrichum karsti]|uniref:Uncharacterized protein n=1 Tax=Colletotrichum karsti TaxID=1095194 RepID=A0A9P6LKB2_9PEZI|nr:uncharacterized protein CkaCkLH20_07252 [Colletotrichum karsti]KAF9875432.1 hypothetical protein CkaCkLH20_07252 [Colletotrichum karsti]